MEISFRKEHSASIVCIADTGAGFAPDSQTDDQHYGLSIMRERSAEMGADFEIVSQIGHGTRVMIRLPYGGGA